MFSFAQLKDKATNGVEYVTVKAYGGEVRLGSLSSADMMEWFADNEDAGKKKIAGLRLLVKSLVNEEGDRVPEDEVEEMVKAFEKKDASHNGKVIAEALKLNGMTRKAKELLKNDSSETLTDVSPSSSPASQG